ncbi:hypothetical protein EON66_12020 [archaeon]|nr:MAG: hypothetical protein EON66_12020 [archaeon]
MSVLAGDHDRDISIEAPLIGSYSGEQGVQSPVDVADAHTRTQPAGSSMSSRAAEQPPGEAPVGAVVVEEEEEEEDDGYTIDHLSAVVRPVAITMILSRYAAHALPTPRACAQPV